MARPAPGSRVWAATRWLADLSSGRQRGRRRRWRLRSRLRGSSRPGRIGWHTEPNPGRPQGTVYGRRPAAQPPSGSGQPPSRPAQYQSDRPLERSGSVTGHILAQGRRDGPTPKTRTAKVLIVMVLVLAFLIAIGLLGATLASDTINDLLGGLLDG